MFTGGGAVVEEMPELAEQIFDLPIRRGAPSSAGGLADHVNNPTFSTAVGVVQYAQRHSPGDAPRLVGAGALGRVADRLLGLFKEFF